MGIKIICAGRGEGKTSFLCAQVAAVAAHGRSVGGIAAPAVFEGDRRCGYDLLDLRTGRRQPLARRAADSDPSCKIGGYRFEEPAFAEGQAAIIAAVEDGLDVVAIDEVGPLEFAGEGWAAALVLALRECRPAQELVVVVRPSLVDQLSERFPAEQWATAVCVRPPWPATLW